MRQGPALKQFTLLLMLLLWLPTFTSVAGAPGPIEGEYRFGHEVNTVCTGQPQRCYWLVETTPEIRAQLKQQVAGLKPYTPVCLRLQAELSDERADGFGRDYDGSIRVLEMLGRCDQAAAESASGIEDLRHRRWILHRIDDRSLADFATDLGFDSAEQLERVPELDFGSQGFVEGNTGCNQFQGQARVVDNNLLLSQMASTAMACAGYPGELELRLQLLYRNPLAIQLEGSDLILKATDTRLRFKRRDWVQ